MINEDSEPRLSLDPGDRSKTLNRFLVVRLDKWLWAARFYKTRSLAQQAIDGGKVRYQRERAQNSQKVQPGAFIQLVLPHAQLEIEVLALSASRGNAQAAACLFRETADSQQQRLLVAAARLSEPASDGRPTKKQRRDLLALKQRQTD